MPRRRRWPFFPVLGPRLRLIGAGGRGCSLGGRKVAIGAVLEEPELAQRRREHRRLARGRRRGLFRLVGGVGGVLGVSCERRRPRRSQRQRILARREERGVRKLHRRRVDGRDDHPHPDPCLVEQLFRKAVGHPDAAVGGGIAGQRAAMQRDAIPRDALHIRHPGIVIHARVVVLVLLDDGKDAGRRLAAFDAGRHRGAHDPAVGVVEGDLLRLDRHDRHDRLARFARRRRFLGRPRVRLFGHGAGGVQHQGDCRRESDRGGRF